MKIKLYESQVDDLLYDLCVRLGFCIPAEDRERLKDAPPTDIEAFADAVYVAEAMDPRAHPKLWEEVVACIAAHFAKAAGESAQTASQSQWSPIFNLREIRGQGPRFQSLRLMYIKNGLRSANINTSRG